MNKSWESNAQLGDYSQQYCIIYIKDTRRLDHNCSHHEKEMIIMWQDEGVTKVVHYINVSHQHAAAAAKSLQSCPTLCDPIDSSPPGSPVPGILQARVLEWVAISFSNAWKWKVKVKSLRRVWLCETPWTAAYQAPPSMGFSRQEYWSGVPWPSPNQHEYTLKLHRVIYQLHLKQINQQTKKQVLWIHSIWIPAPNSYYLLPVWSETNHNTPMRGDTCVCTTDSLFCVPKTNTTL